MEQTHLIGHAAAAVFALALVGASAGTAQARGNDEVRATGHCSKSSTAKLKAKSDDGRLEVEVEVDSNRVGQTWSVSMADNGSRFFHGSRRTAGPSGSFGVERRTANRAGRDRVTAVATNTRSGERCTVVLTHS
jgi:hypothetical protein